MLVVCVQYSESIFFIHCDIITTIRSVVICHYTKFTVLLTILYMIAL